MYLLDTNIVAELYKLTKGRADPQVIKWFSTIRTADCFISSVTLAETKIGVLNLTRKDPIQAKPLEKWFENDFLFEFAKRTISIDADIALTYATFHVPDKKPINDAYIGATAKAKNLVLVTRNVKDFATFGIEIINPFEE